MTLKVLWRSRLGAEEAALHGLDARFELRIETDDAAAEALADWAAVLVDGSPSERLLDGARLERVVVPYAGVSDRLREALRHRPHLGLHNSHFNAGFVAQHALALLLACTNRIPQADHALRRGDWRPRYDPDFDSRYLTGRHCLLLGYGAIGKELEPRVRALGMEVAAFSRTRPAEADGALAWYGPERLAEALAATDVVMASLPSTPHTRGLLDEDALAAMRPGAILVNVGRAEVVDQHALYRALEAGALFGAGIDVWWRYPEHRAGRASTLPSEAPLHTLANVVMSPHRANQTEAWKRASFEDVRATLAAIVRGEERNRVDTVLGY